MNENQLSALALNAIRNSLPLDSWDKFAEAIVSDRRRRQTTLVKPEPDRSWFGLVDELRTNGFAKLPITLPEPTTSAIRKYFKTESVHKGPHVFSYDGKAK